MAVPGIAEIYVVCAVVGALCLVLSAMLGGFAHGHGGHGAGHGGGHLGGHGAGQGGWHLGGHGSGHGGLHLGHPLHGHVGSHSGAHVSGHGPTHAAPAGGQAAGHGAQSSSHQSAGQGSQTEAQPATPGATSQSNSTLPMAAATNQPTGRSSQDTAILILTLLNPTTLSSFAVWFGASGLISWRLLQFLPIAFTLPIALLGGVAGTKLTMDLMGLLARTMYASGSFSQDSLIGLQAEVTVAVQPGKTGEITCVAGGPRYTFSARSLDPDTSFKRSDAVIISDIRDDIAYIETWPEFDETIEPAAPVIRLPAASKPPEQ